MALRTHANPAAADYVDPVPPSREPLALHRRLPGYRETPLVEAPGIARLLGVRQVWVKDESSRLELPSFKILGASWAAFRALAGRLGDRGPVPEGVEELAARLEPLRPLALAAATDGNHGRAVARMARLLRLDARIFVPARTAEARIRAIEGEGAVVTVVDGTYEDAVIRAAGEAGERCLLVQDTAVEGYEEPARWVIEGYATLFWEIEERLEALGSRPPDVVAVQIGVGALAASAVRHFRRPAPAPRPRLVGVEPDRAACVLRSMEAGRIVSVPGPHDSVMAGLNCGRPSEVAWPEVSSGMDLFVAVGDEAARRAVREMAAAGVVSGETGAAGLAGLGQVLDRGDLRDLLGVDEGSSVLLLSTEGATDPEAYRAIVG